MLSPTILRRAGLALFVLVIGLIVACGEESATPAAAPVDNGVAVPAYLLPRTPLLPNYPITLQESAKLNMKPHIYGPVAMSPGQSFQFAVSVFDCCVVIRPVQGKTVWSVEPEGTVTIDPQSGMLLVEDSATHGAVVTLSVQVDDGAATVDRNLTIFSTQQNPLVGRWKENSDGEGLRELLILADGQYTATWSLLEDYMDLFGTYTVDPVTKEVEFTKDWARVETAGFQGKGQFVINAEDRLQLSGICPTNADLDNPGCVRHFTRSR